MTIDVFCWFLWMVQEMDLRWWWVSLTHTHTNIIHTVISILASALPRGLTILTTNYTFCSPVLHTEWKQGNNERSQVCVWIKNLKITTDTPLLLQTCPVFPHFSFLLALFFFLTSVRLKRKCVPSTLCVFIERCGLRVKVIKLWWEGVVTKCVEPTWCGQGNDEAGERYFIYYKKMN